MDKKEITEFFDVRAEGWDAVQVRNETAINFILEKGGVSKGKHILDVACGTGVLFSDYIIRGAVVTGIDISSQMIKVAKKKFPQINVICADAENYSFEDKFDAVMIYNAFPHFPNPMKLFENLAKALKVNGRLTVAHGISEKELRECHATAAKNVCLPLPSKETLADVMSDYYEVDVMISDEEMYIVSGVKKHHKQ